MIRARRKEQQKGREKFNLTNRLCCISIGLLLLQKPDMDESEIWIFCIHPKLIRKERIYFREINLENQPTPAELENPVSDESGFWGRCSGSYIQWHCVSL